MKKKRDRIAMQMWQNIFQMLNLVIENKGFLCTILATFLWVWNYFKIKLKNQILKIKCDKIRVRLLTEEGQLLLRENKENLKKWRNKPYSWIESQIL